MLEHIKVSTAICQIWSDIVFVRIEKILTTHKRKIRIIIGAQ